MTQLTYNEAFDPYHAVFRMIRLHNACKFHEPVAFDMLRILDFYLLFPFRIQAISLHSDDLEWRKTSKSYEWMSPYGGMPDDILVFSRMEPFQKAAISSLAAAGSVSTEFWENSEVQFLDQVPPENVAQRVSRANNEMQDIMGILCAINDRYGLMGTSGIKARSKLMEYRYDAV